MTEIEPVKKIRTRLSPTDRKAMILDHAANLIASEGVSSVTMERLGQEAGISKALVYNYYPNVVVLLQTLLTREYKRIRKLQFKAAESAETLEQLVRRVTNVYLSYIQEHGLLIDRLAAEPMVADAADPTEYGREAAVDYIAHIISKNFEIEMELARPVIDISYGLPAAAGHYITHHDSNLQTIEDITVTMIIGSLQAIKEKYETSLRPLLKN
jgi:AcrR family transcriptional regulator